MSVGGYDRLGLLVLYPFGANKSSVCYLLVGHTHPLSNHSGIFYSLFFRPKQAGKSNAARTPRRPQQYWLEARLNAWLNPWWRAASLMKKRKPLFDRDGWEVSSPSRVRENRRVHVMEVVMESSKFVQHLPLRCRARPFRPARLYCRPYRLSLLPVEALS